MKILAKKIFQIIINDSNLKYSEAYIIGRCLPFTQTPAAEVMYVLRDEENKLVGGHLKVGYSRGILFGCTITFLDNSSHRINPTEAEIYKLRFCETEFELKSKAESEILIDSSDPWLFLPSKKSKLYIHKLSSDFYYFISNLLSRADETPPLQ